MIIAATDWREIEGEREKYQAYLCSREWAEKRRDVIARADGVCERCRAKPVDAVHHLTYVRKYDEPLTDLQGLCNGCHEFTHGKSDADPVLADRPIGLTFPADFEYGALKCPACGSKDFCTTYHRHIFIGLEVPHFFHAECHCQCGLDFSLRIHANATGLESFVVCDQRQFDKLNKWAQGF